MRIWCTTEKTTKPRLHLSFDRLRMTAGLRQRVTTNKLVYVILSLSKAVLSLSKDGRIIVQFARIYGSVAEGNILSFA